MKKQVIDALIEKSQVERESLLVSARNAHRDATHEESKPEDQYDTRGLEASYLAGAQAVRLRELDGMISDLKSMALALSSATSSPHQVGVGALVEVTIGGPSGWYLVIGQRGGTVVEVLGKSIQVITPQGPLGEALMDARAGDTIEFEMRGITREGIVRQIY